MDFNYVYLEFNVFFNLLLIFIYFKIVHDVVYQQKFDAIVSELHFQGGNMSLILKKAVVEKDLLKTKNVYDIVRSQRVLVTFSFGFNITFNLLLIFIYFKIVFIY